MNYKVGDAVKYESGDWWFYGTITAIIDNSICPCYRLMVERMVKKNCKLSITQFEFELESDDEVDNNQEKSKWENAEMAYLKKYNQVQKIDVSPQVLIPEPEHKPVPVPQPQPQPEPQPEKKQRVKKEEPVLEKVEEVQSQVVEAPAPRRGTGWDKFFEMYQKGMKSNPIYNWISQNRRQYKDGILSKDKVEKLLTIRFPFESNRKSKSENIEEQPEPVETPKRRRSDAWEKNLELYLQGVRSNTIYTWMSQNRRLYKIGKLKDEHLEKLIENNFPFDLIKKRKG